MAAASSTVGKTVVISKRLRFSFVYTKSFPALCILTTCPRVLRVLHFFFVTCVEPRDAPCGVRILNKKSSKKWDDFTNHTHYLCANLCTLRAAKSRIKTKRLHARAPKKWVTREKRLLQAGACRRASINRAPTSRIPSIWKGSRAPTKRDCNFDNVMIIIALRTLESLRLVKNRKTRNVFRDFSYIHIDIVLVRRSSLLCVSKATENARIARTNEHEFDLHIFRPHAMYFFLFMFAHGGRGPVEPRAVE